MRPDTRRAIAERAQSQLGLIHRHQLNEIGLSKDNIEILAANNHIDPLGFDVFRIAGVPQSYEQLVLAACLDTGGIASHRTAARLHRLNGFRSTGVIEVTVTRDLHHGTHPLAIVHTSTNVPADDRVTVGPLPATGVARTFLGLAALVPTVPRGDIEVALGDAARDGLVSDAWLWWRLEKLRCRGRNGVTVLDDILRTRQRLGPTESWLEHEFLRLLERAGLPLPVVQRRVRVRGNAVARVDTMYEDRRLVIELDGHADHSTREQRARDARRRRGLVHKGYAVLVFTYDEVVRAPDEVIDEVRLALDRDAA